MPRLNILVIAGLLILLQGCATGVVLGTMAALGGGTTAVMNDRRHSDVQHLDGEVYKTINEFLTNDRTFSDHTQIKADVFNKVVLLAGRASSESMRQNVLEMASQIKGVRRIHNEIDIAPVQTEEQKEDDTLLTAKIRTILIGKKWFDASLVQFTVMDGVVYLMGLVTREEAAEVEDVVRRIEGVARVVSLFEYVNLIKTS